MNDTLQFIFSLSIVFAAVIGIVRYRSIDPSYYPFLYYTWIVLLVELLLYFLMEQGLKHYFSSILNIYGFVEFSLFTWLFHKWRLFDRNRNIFTGILIFFAIAWIIITLIIGHFTEPNFYFRILFSFALIFFSVSTFNKVVIHERGNIFTNSKFLICLGIIIFYSFFIVVCATNSVFREDVGKLFLRELQEINVYSNLLVNLLYAVAVIWMPRKKKFTTLF